MGEAFRQRLPGTLNDAAMNLAMQDQRIDRLTAIVDRRVALERHRTGLGIDLDLTDGRASRIGRDASGEARLACQRRAQLRRQRLLSREGARNVEDIEPAVGTR